MAATYDEPTVAYDWGPLTFDGDNAIGAMTGTVGNAGSMAGSFDPAAAMTGELSPLGSMTGTLT